MESESILLINKGFPVGLPASNQVGLIAEADGTVKKIDSAGTRTTLGGSPVTDSIITAGSNLQDLVLAPSEWTLNGDTDGDYLIEGTILTPAGATGTNYSFQPTADASNAVGGELIAGTGVAAQWFELAFLGMGTGATNAGRLHFQIWFQSKSGRIRQYLCHSYRRDPTAPTTLYLVQVGEYTATATVVDATTRIHASVAASILTGSYARIRRLLNTT